MNKNSAYFETMQSITLLIARVALASVFIQSGWGKFQHLPKVIEYFESLHVPMPHLQAPFVAGVEFLGGLAILLGLGSRIFSILLSVTMVVAVITAKREDLTGILSLFDLTEVLYAILFLILFAFGPGKLSLARTLNCKKAILE